MSCETVKNLGLALIYQQLGMLMYMKFNLKLLFVISILKVKHLF